MQKKKKKGRTCADSCTCVDVITSTYRTLLTQTWGKVSSRWMPSVLSCTPLSIDCFALLVSFGESAINDGTISWGTLSPWPEDTVCVYWVRMFVLCNQERVGFKVWVCGWMFYLQVRLVYSTHISLWKLSSDACPQE